MYNLIWKRFDHYFFSKKNTLLHYVISILITSLTVYFYSTVSGHFWQGFYLQFYPLVFLMAWYFGAGPAVVSTILMAVGFVYFFIQPIHTFEVNYDEFLRIIVFLFSSGLVTWVISRSQRIEMKLADSVERFRLATEASKLGVWELDFESGETITNIHHDRAFGFQESAEDWKLSDFMTYLHPDDRNQLVLSIREALNSDNYFNVEGRVIWRDGSIHWINIAGKRNKQKDKIYGVVRDITQTKENEEALKEALFYRDEFLSIASHELKTPLTSLKLNCQIFKRYSEKNGLDAYNQERVDRLVSTTDQQVSRLVRLVDDMLDISRIRTGQLSFTKEEINLSKLLQEVLERLSPQFLEYKSGIPHVEIVKSIRMMGDRLRIEQVISNLISNALKYGRGNPIEVKLTKHDKFAKLSVSDRGIGIAPEFIDKVFLRFQRAVPASEVSGLGLGLYIAKQIVEAHDGVISLESKLNEGSTFNVEFPCY